MDPEDRSTHAVNSIQPRPSELSWIAQHRPCAFAICICVRVSGNACIHACMRANTPSKLGRVEGEARFQPTPQPHAFGHTVVLYLYVRTLETSLPRLLDVATDSCTKQLQTASTLIFLVAHTMNSTASQIAGKLRGAAPPGARKKDAGQTLHAQLQRRLEPQKPEGMWRPCRIWFARCWTFL